MGRTKLRSRRPYLGRRKQNRRKAVGLQNTKPSASDQKLSCFGISFDQLQKRMKKITDETNESEDGYLFVQQSCLQSLVGQLLCPSCKNPGVTVSVPDIAVQGFAAKYILCCINCKTSIDESFLCERAGNSSTTNSPFTINTRAMLAFRSIGCGFCQIKTWFGSMNMPYNVSHDTYSKHHQKIHQGSITTFEEIKRDSLKAIQDAYKDIGILPDKNDILDISVSFDGSWQRMGHASHNGVAVAIDLLTGLPVDYEVLSNFCLKCKVAEDNPPNLLWKEKHAANCPKNFHGSSNAMEAECARRLWRRSEEKNHLRYTTMLCDGDSKSYDSVVADSPYGDAVIIEKKDCLNHVSKRMGKALRDLIALSKSQKESISGKGKLTQEKVNKIQNYYGRAIKDNVGDIPLLKKRIFAILLHLSSSDKNPKHVHCPPGETSWCFWQRAIAKSETPGSHADHETLPSDVGRKLVPIFQRLSEENLLKRCACSATQNANESLHNLIWKQCPKTTFCGRKTVETAVALALCQFSMGATSQSVLCRVLGMTPGVYFERHSVRKDIKRLEKANIASQEGTKKRRKQLKFNKTIKDHQVKQNEGQTYEGGQFNG